MHMLIITVQVYTIFTIINAHANNYSAGVYTIFTIINAHAHNYSEGVYHIDLT